MSSYAFNYSFNITGNCDVVVQGITQGVKDLNDKIHKSVGLWDSFEGKLLALNQFTQYIEGVGRTMQETLQPGAALNASLADLSAISGETGESLRDVPKGVVMAASAMQDPVVAHAAARRLMCHSSCM